MKKALEMIFGGFLYLLELVIIYGVIAGLMLGGLMLGIGKNQEIGPAFFIGLGLSAVWTVFVIAWGRKLFAEFRYAICDRVFPPAAPSFVQRPGDPPLL